MNQFSASLWGDEAWAATLAVKPVWQIIQIVSRDTSPPLYYLLLHLWMKIFGTSEVAIRSLSFLFFLGAVLTVYFIGRHLWDKKTGVLAAALTFVNPFLFQYAFEGRMYSLLLLTATLSVYFFLKKQRLGFILATLSALYTHHFSLFVVLVEAIWLFRETWSKPKREILGQFSQIFLIGLFYLPWLYPLYYQTSLVASGFWLGKPNLESLTGLFEKFLLGGQDYLLKTALLFSFLLILVLRRWQENSWGLFLASWFLLPILLVFFISRVASASIFFDRYLLFTIPPLILLLASKIRLGTYFILAFTILVLLSVNYHYFTHPTKRPFRELATYVKSAQKEEDFLINYPGVAHHLFESKYYGLLAPIYSPGGPLPFYTGTALMEPQDVIGSLPEIGGRLGVIGSGESEKLTPPDYLLVEKKTFGSLYFLWLAKKT